MTKKAKKQLINISFLIVLITVTVVVMFISQDLDIRDVGKFISSCGSGYGFLIGAFAGLLGYVLFEAASLHIIARKLGHKSKVTSSLAYSASDLYYSAITPSASGGQPASAYYMCRDGMSGGIAGFTVLLNIIGYTVATILVGLFAIVVKPGMFLHIGHWFAQLLIIFGFLVQILLLVLLLLCLVRARVVHKIGSFGIRFLTKLHIVKRPEKWYKKLDNVITKYRSCRGVLREHPVLFLIVLFMNILQRVSQTLIPCFVIMAAKPDAGFLELFCMQSYVMIGYNSVPLPGGTGVYEYLYPNIFGIGGYDKAFVFSAMMVSRAISYYICMILCGLYTLVYHVVGLRNIKDEPAALKDESPDRFDILSALGDKLDPLESPQPPQHFTYSEGEVTVDDDPFYELVSRPPVDAAQSQDPPADCDQTTPDKEEP